MAVTPLRQDRAELERRRPRTTGSQHAGNEQGRAEPDAGTGEEDHSEDPNGHLSPADIGSRAYLLLGTRCSIDARGGRLRHRSGSGWRIALLSVSIALRWRRIALVVALGRIALIVAGRRIALLPVTGSRCSWRRLR